MGTGSFLGEQTDRQDDDQDADSNGDNNEYSADDVLTFRRADGESSRLHQRADPTGCLEVMMVFRCDRCKDCTFAWTFEE